ncbi:MAG: NUDIX domain-containing protein [Minisyncoccia bacterium]
MAEATESRESLAGLEGNLRDRAQFSNVFTKLPIAGVEGTPLPQDLHRGIVRPGHESWGPKDDINYVPTRIPIEVNDIIYARKFNGKPPYADNWTKLFEGDKAELDKVKERVDVGNVMHEIFAQHAAKTQDAAEGKAAAWIELQKLYSKGQLKTAIYSHRGPFVRRDEYPEYNRNLFEHYKGSVNYVDNSGMPLFPFGRTGVKDSLLGKVGPNHAADAIIFGRTIESDVFTQYIPNPKYNGRDVGLAGLEYVDVTHEPAEGIDPNEIRGRGWFKITPDSLEKMKTGLFASHGKFVNEAIKKFEHLKDGGLILLIQRPDGSWAVPGGMVDPGEDTPMAATREAKEETGVTVNMSKGVEILSDVVDDTRGGDHSWMETTVHALELERFAKKTK